MQKVYAILDQNYLRKIDSEFFRNNPSTMLIIPDSGLMEMCKSDSWKEIMFHSLKGLSDNPNKCNTTIGIGQAFRYEIKNRHSIDGKWFNKELTQLLRKLLIEISQSKDGEVVKRMGKDMISIQDKLKNDELNDTINRKMLGNQINIIKEMISSENLKALRAKKIPLQVKLDTIKECAPRFLGESLYQAGFPKNKIGNFLKQKPALLRWTYLRIWYELDWIEKGGFETSKTITNDYIDQDYILTATFFDKFLSDDQKAIDAYNAISKIINTQSFMVVPRT